MRLAPGLSVAGFTEEHRQQRKRSSSNRGGGSASAASQSRATGVFSSVRATTTPVKRQDATQHNRLVDVRRNGGLVDGGCGEDGVHRADKNFAILQSLCRSRGIGGTELSGTSNTSRRNSRGSSSCCTDDNNGNNNSNNVESNNNSHHCPPSSHSFGLLNTSNVDPFGDDNYGSSDAVGRNSVKKGNSANTRGTGIETNVPGEESLILVTRVGGARASKSENPSDDYGDDGIVDGNRVSIEDGSSSIENSNSSSNLDSNSSNNTDGNSSSNKGSSSSSHGGSSNGDSNVATLNGSFPLGGGAVGKEVAATATTAAAQLLQRLWADNEKERTPPSSNARPGPLRSRVLLHVCAGPGASLAVREALARGEPQSDDGGGSCEGGGGDYGLLSPEGSGKTESDQGNGGRRAFGSATAAGADNREGVGCKVGGCTVVALGSLREDGAFCIAEIDVPKRGRGGSGGGGTGWSVGSVEFGRIDYEGVQEGQS